MHAPVVSEFATSDPEQAHAIVAAAYADNHLRVSGSLEDFRLELAAQDLGEITFSAARSTLTTEYAVDPLDRVIIGRILHGGLTTESEHSERVVGPGQTLLMARPGYAYTTRFQDYRASAVAIDLSVFAQVSDQPEGALTDQLVLGLPPPDRAYLWQHTVDYAMTILLGGSESATSPLVLGSTARLLAAAAITVFGHPPDPQAFDRNDALPVTVRRAVSYIESNPDLDLGVADIARASNVSVRALQLAFRRHLDTTPMRYLRRVRLDLARRDLQHAVAGTGTTVTEVATRRGYADLSRFAADYRAAYGEHPHVTLRRAGL